MLTRLQYDRVEGPDVESHGGVSNELLFDGMVQRLELSPEIRQIATGRACIYPHVPSQRGSSGEGPSNLTLIRNVLLEVVRVERRQKGGGETFEYCLWFLLEQTRRLRHDQQEVTG